ncbi:MraY family glycosyltransferase [Actinomycetaceae bacterium MB13-C1-2]|nr:MraY family glycosyltransferase [Actinomycetaceae bacterium MB13-C1-2]
MRLYLLLLLISTAATLVLTPVVRRIALGFNVLTPLRERDVHATPIPRLGGIALTGGITLTILVGYSIPYFKPVYSASPALWAVLVGSVAICLLGAVDDIWELDWMTKLAGQFLVAGGMATAGVQLINIPLFGVTIGSSRLSILISALILVAIMNAVNFVDGLDGLASGVIAIGSLGFFAYSYILQRLMGEPTYVTGAAIVTIALAGACMAFLWFNFHPASIFMGDSGAMVLGLVLGSAAIIVTGQVNPMLLTDDSAAATWMPLIIPMAVLIIPLADLVITPALRMLHGKSPVTADRTHLHDRLLVQGHSHRGVVLIMYAWTALVCTVAILALILPTNEVLLWALPFLVGTIIATAYQFPGHRRRKAGVRGTGTPGGKVAIDDGVEVISRAGLGVWYPLMRSEHEHSQTKNEDKQ